MAVRPFFVAPQLRWGGNRNFGGIDTCPIFAAAQEAEETALDTKDVRRLKCDIGRICVAVLRIVNLSVPLIVLALGHTKQNRHSQSRPRTQSGIRVLAVDTGLHFPRHYAPHLPIAVDDLIRASFLATSHSPVGAGDLCRSGCRPRWRPWPPARPRIQRSPVVVLKSLNGSAVSRGPLKVVIGAELTPEIDETAAPQRIFAICLLVKSAKMEPGTAPAVLW